MENIDKDIFNLMNDRNGLLRTIREEKWNEESNIVISNSEWNIMEQLYKNQSTISTISRTVQISRQATHKFIKKLETKGLVESLQGNNNRDKFIQLTQLGERCVEKHRALKLKLEKKIAEKIGQEQLLLLKGILTSDWGI